MNKWSACCFALLLLGLSAAASLHAQSTTYRVDSQAQWQAWSFPAGTLELGADGSITPTEFPVPLNASLDAHEYIHKVSSKEWQGGIRKAGSNLATAGNIIDGNLETYWQPDPEAPVQDWMVEIDLGRAVPVTMIRLHFPDEEGARPLREFRVLVTNGRLQSSSQVIFAYEVIGSTTRWNDETVVEFPLSSTELDRLVFRDGPAAAGADTSTSFKHLQYVRVLAETKSADAAIAEVEVLTYGENLAVGLVERGGSTDDQGVTGRAWVMVDGDVNTSMDRTRSEASAPAIRFDWDLGAVYWINRALVLGSLVRGGEDRGIKSVAQILGSDGRLLPTAPAPGEGPRIDYEIIFDFVPESVWRIPLQVNYLIQPYRKLRHLALVFDSNTGGAFDNIGAISEVAFYPVGHVAEVTTISNHIEIADRPKILGTLSWEADLPAGTQIEVNTRSGNTFVDRTIYYDRNGEEVSEEIYNGLRKSKRGDTVAVSEPGPDWSSWSNPYRSSGLSFLSPNPRRYVQFRVTLKSDRPEVAPILRALLLDFEDAFLEGAVGTVQPQRAEPGVAQTFTYTLQPSFATADLGFDRILVETPARANRDSLVLRLDGSPMEPADLSIFQDSLVIQLPQVVQREEVEIDINVPVLENPYVFDVFMGHSERPDHWQRVDESERFALNVFLFGIAEATSLIDKLSIEPSVFTPNGDGVGDATQIRFAVLKTRAPAQVRIYSLAGELIRELAGDTGPDGFRLYDWGGTDQSGGNVAPGIYLCRVELDAQAKKETLVRLVHVAY